MKNKGFTLIELLVVIAIIGILASIVLASLNTARNKGTDAAIKANLANIRAQAEIFYDGTGAGTYGTGGDLCSTAGSLFAADATIANAIVAADSANGAETVVCHNTTSAWAISANLVSDGTAWCVDSTGASESITIDDDAGDTSCALLSA